MAGFVYLISDSDSDGIYKIGVTRKDPFKRIKELQTGNSGELFLVNYHKSEYPFFVEHSLHDRFSNSRKKNEWFSLTMEQVRDFKKTCGEIEDMLLCLKDNVYIKKLLSKYKN